MAQKGPATLDHIIILLPSLTNLPQSLTTNFTITPGGTHGDGLTANVLIPLRSGTYLELIAFTAAAPRGSAARASHWWGDMPEGSIVDWCLGGFPPPLPAAAAAPKAGHAGIDEAAGEEEDEEVPVAYAASQRGGRLRPDGVRVEWSVTFPVPALRRGSVPFWCADLTPRALRVPGTDDDAVAAAAAGGEGSGPTHHPCGAVAVAAVRVVVAGGSAVKAWARAYARVVWGVDGAEGKVVEGEDGWEVEMANPLEGLGRREGLKPRVKIQEASNPWETEMSERNGGAPFVAELEIITESSVRGSSTHRVEIDETFGQGVESGRMKISLI